MVEEGEKHEPAINEPSSEEWLSRAQGLVPRALESARQVKNFLSRWKAIISKLEQVPSRLSDLSSHPCFSKNALCREQLQSICNSLNRSIELAKTCLNQKYEGGKLRMQSELDALAGGLDLSLRDCGLLVKTGVLGSVSCPSPTEPDDGSGSGSVHRELLARLQIGHLESKHRALDGLVEVMKEDEGTILSVITRSNVSSLVQLLTATSPRIRETAVTVVSSLAEAGGGNCEEWLAAEGAVPPLIRLVDSGSGSSVAREKAAIALQRLSVAHETARSIAAHGGVGPLVETCRTGGSVLQSSAACTLRNISSVPEARQVLADEGTVRVMVSLLESSGPALGPKEHAAECLQNLTSGTEGLRRLVVSEGGLARLLAYIDGPFPQESAVGAVRNLAGSVSPELLLSLGFLPRMSHVLGSGSLGAKVAATSAVSRVCTSNEMKRLAGEEGCIIPSLVGMLGDKSAAAREVAAQAVAGLMAVSGNRRAVKRDERSVPLLVALLDPSPGNGARKYAVACLGMLASSRKCRKAMVSYGAIGYLKKLSDADVVGAKKLLERLEKGGKLKSLFARK